MTGTGFLTTAYNGRMETILLLFLLSTLEKDPAAKQQLSSLLKFYRENRELLSSLTGREKSQPQREYRPHEEEKEYRPHEEKDGNLKILEEYLKN